VESKAAYLAAETYSSLDSRGSQNSEGRSAIMPSLGQECTVPTVEYTTDLLQPFKGYPSDAQR